MVSVPIPDNGINIGAYVIMRDSKWSFNYWWCHWKAPAPFNTSIILLTLQIQTRTQYIILIKQPLWLHWLGTSAWWNVASACQPCWSDLCLFAHACAAPFERLRVCQAKRCSAAHIRPGKADSVHSSTATAVYIGALFLWGGSDLTWIAERNNGTNYRRVQQG